MEEYHCPHNNQVKRHTTCSLDLHIHSKWVLDSGKSAQKSWNLLHAFNSGENVQARLGMKLSEEDDLENNGMYYILCTKVLYWHVCNLTIRPALSPHYSNDLAMTLQWSCNDLAITSHFIRQEQSSVVHSWPGGGQRAGAETGPQHKECGACAWWGLCTHSWCTTNVHLPSFVSACH